MNPRQRLEIIILFFLILLTFASYHEGSTVWLQWLTVVVFSTFLLVFDWVFTNESNFLFDPDAENWRRKTVSVFHKSSIPITTSKTNFLTTISLLDPRQEAAKL